jgi:hypothetical protein
MSDTPTVLEVDCSTGVTTERPMTDEEIAAQQAMAEQAAADQAAREAAASAKAAAQASATTKLEALGLSEDEIAAIIGA